MLIGEGYEVYRHHLRHMQRCTHGTATFDVSDEVSAQRNRFWLALARVDGEPIGSMLYDL